MEGPDQDINVLEEETLLDEVALVVGTRPGIVMFAPVIAELREEAVPFFLLHTGQHYSPEMDSQLFRDLGLPQAHHRLEGVAEHRTHGAQTAAMLAGIESVLINRRPRLVVVGGDANTNLAGALAARKLGLMVAHLEAGERSFDMRMPEEVNRVMIDHISDYLFVTGEKAAVNLTRESVRGEVVETGNTIVDASQHHLARARETSTVLRDHELDACSYALATLHRQETVDHPRRLERCLSGLSAAAAALGFSITLPLHPRTAKRLRQYELDEWAIKLPGLHFIGAVPYLDFLQLLVHASVVFTDSGGVQQEACIHGIPCVTLRESTEWTETLECGANRLAGCESERIVEAGLAALRGGRSWPAVFGDGRAAARVVAACRDILARRRVTSAAVR